MQNSLGIFKPVTYKDLNFLGDLRLSYTFHLQPIYPQTSIFLALTSKYLLYFQNEKQKNPIGICDLNFDLKFQILRQTPWINQLTPGKPIGIRFQKQTGNHTYQTLQVYYHQDRLIDIWRQNLQRLLNQRNFHSLFKAKRKIGKGAFATVYLAQRLTDKKIFAVKAFSKERQFGGQQGKESLINQINIMRMVNHQNVIQLQGVFETQNSIYVVLQMLEGRLLHQRLKNNQIKSEDDIKNVILNILKGLKALAEKNIIHRDLKPQNIIFRSEGSTDLAICDFGLATKAHEEKYLFVRCGTPGFVSPQIINIRDMSTKSQSISDIFSAGLIFHVLLFGKSIFQGTRYNEILAQNRACSFNFLKDMYSNLNPLALDLLKKMLEVNPSMRISAQKALEHPYFVKEQLSQMIDEKFENITIDTHYSLRNKKKSSNYNGFQKKENEILKKNSCHQNIMECQKQNDERIIMKKNTSVFDEPMPTIRRSKRNSTHENQMKYKIRRY